MVSDRSLVSKRRLSPLKVAVGAEEEEEWKVVAEAKEERSRKKGRENKWNTHL